MSLSGPMIAVNFRGELISTFFDDQYPPIMGDSVCLSPTNAERRAANLKPKRVPSFPAEFLRPPGIKLT